MKLTTDSHPCYNCGASGNARIHLPVAPKCNIQCNYCLRKYDCTNESRPGVSSAVLSVSEAAARYRAVKEKMPNLTVVGIAGPGDALANFDTVAGTLEAIRSMDDSVLFCLSTNGLALPRRVKGLSQLGVSHLTVTLNAVDAQIGQQIYSWVNYEGSVYTGLAAAELLLANQIEGIRKAVELGMVVKINVVALTDINISHIPEVAKASASLGAEILNIMPHIAVEGTGFAGLPSISRVALDDMRDECAVYIKQMKHCRQCRADAIGTLSNDRSIEFRKQPTALRFAVASRDGRVVDEHFGQAENFYIYESDGNTVHCVDIRNVEKYCSGDDCESDRRNRVFEMIDDCDAVLCTRIGVTPAGRLKAFGMQVFTDYDYTQAAVLSFARKMLSEGSQGRGKPIAPACSACPQ